MVGWILPRRWAEVHLPEIGNFDIPQSDPDLDQGQAWAVGALCCRYSASQVGTQMELNASRLI